MKKSFNLFILIATIILVATFVFCSNKKQKPTPVSDDTFIVKPGKVQKIEYIIVKSAFFNESEIFKENAAFLISDREEIVENQELFLAEQEYHHTCGYDYSILFWKDMYTLSEEVSLNSECEIFSYKPREAQQLLESYKRKLETEPTHYIYNLELSVKTDLEEVKAVFRNSDLNVFFFDGVLGRLPYIYFYYRHNTFVGKNASRKDWEKAEVKNEAKTRVKINEIIKSIRGITDIFQQSEIHYYSYGRAGDRMTHNGQVELVFEYGTDLEKVIDLLKKEGAQIGENAVPVNYFIQLVDTSSNISNVKQKMKKYEIVKNVYEYSE